MTDTIERAQSRMRSLRHILALVRAAEAKERAANYRELETWHADMAREQLGRFMFRACGWPSPAPVVHDQKTCYRQAQGVYADAVMAIPLPRFKPLPLPANAANDGAPARTDISHAA
ncbi:MAG TPA: hypothetical protein VLC71_06095 [Thermomonas sp.]|nr:hypothetical protein [Thermomonas sp.]